MADKPVLVLNDKLLELAVWANEIVNSEGSPYVVYSFTLRKSYTANDGNWKTTSNFSGSEFLRLAGLLMQANVLLNIKVTHNSGFE